MKGKRALVTGGAGFIGSHLVNELLSQGVDVTVLDNLSTGKLSNLEGVQDQITFQEGDIRNLNLLNDLLVEVDYVFHQAAFVSVPLSIENPDECFEINAVGTVQLMSAAARAGVKRLVFASSAAVYGDNPQIPLQESAKLRPQSPYAVSKLVDELYKDLYTENFDLEVVALRYFNVFGPKQPPDSDYAAAIPIFFRRMMQDQEPVVYGDGGQSRDFIYVEDVTRANVLAAVSEGAAGKVFNICSGIETSILDLIRDIGEVLDKDLEIIFEDPRPGDIYRSVGDPGSAGEILGFKPEFSLESGLRKTAEAIADLRSINDQQFLEST